MGTSTRERPGYSAAIRRFELASLIAFAAACMWTLWRLWPHAAQSAWLMVAAAATGYLAADFTSGLVHWIFDTWGTPKTPLLGAPFIRPFREHHTDEKAITRHDFVETNANNCFIGLLPLLGVAFVPLDGRGMVFAVAFVFWLVLFTMLTNQFHKWAHADAPPRVATLLQRVHLILPPDHHARHHRHPFHGHYAITTGWTNRIADTLRVYRALEWLIRVTTGAVPRRDDLGEAHALDALESARAESFDAGGPREVARR